MTDETIKGPAPFKFDAQKEHEYCNEAVCCLNNLDFDTLVEEIRIHRAAAREEGRLMAAAELAILRVDARAWKIRAHSAEVATQRMAREIWKLEGEVADLKARLDLMEAEYLKETEKVADLKARLEEAHENRNITGL